MSAKQRLFGASGQISKTMKATYKNEKIDFEDLINRSITALRKTLTIAQSL
jgi:hypothetical protein